MHNMDVIEHIQMARSTGPLPTFVEMIYQWAEKENAAGNTSHSFPPSVYCYCSVGAVSHLLRMYGFTVTESASEYVVSWTKQQA